MKPLYSTSSLLPPGTLCLWFSACWLTQLSSITWCLAFHGFQTPPIPECPRNDTILSVIVAGYSSFFRGLVEGDYRSEEILLLRRSYQNFWCTGLFNLKSPLPRFLHGTSLLKQCTFHPTPRLISSLLKRNLYVFSYSWLVKHFLLFF